MFTRHSRHSFEPVDTPSVKGCNFDEDPRWTECVCIQSEHAEDFFPPVRPAGYTVVLKKGPALAETGEPREPPPHRPVRSTVNACSVPPLTTILASCHSHACPATASNEHRFCLRTTSEDLTRGWPDVLVSEDIL